MQLNIVFLLELQCEGEVQVFDLDTRICWSVVAERLRAPNSNSGVLIIEMEIGIRDKEYGIRLGFTHIHLCVLALHSVLSRAPGQKS